MTRPSHKKKAAQARLQHRPARPNPARSEITHQDPLLGCLVLSLWPGEPDRRLTRAVAVAMPVLGFVATVVIFMERFTEGAWTYFIFIPLLYAWFSFSRTSEPRRVSAA